MARNQVRERGIKVLSLFFIDRVANSRDSDGAGRPIKGKFAQAFEAELSAMARDERYRALTWLEEPIDKLHNGYFAQDKKGVLKDTRGDTQADDEVYNLIMKDKERLLGLEEPLRFIFSHSALREGWDNLNVFQICTLNETRSVLKKRQEIGRGLRLPVDQNGLRVEFETDVLVQRAEMINYLSALQVHKSVYEYVVYDSEVERAFASQLDAREDIKLFVKLPGWFQIDTPVGTYNPDWAILKHDGQALYLVRETKETRDFLQLRTSEADKIRCGQQHLATLGVLFAVAVSADEV